MIAFLYKVVSILFSLWLCFISLDIVNRIFLHFVELWHAIKSVKIYLIFIPIQVFINNYIFSEWDFARGFFIIFLIDTWSGIFIAWRTKTFSVKILREKLLDKSVAYFSLIIGWSTATKIGVNGSSEGILQYMDLGFYNIFVVAEFFSILKNWYKYKPSPILKKLMKHFDGFDSETGEKE